MLQKELTEATDGVLDFIGDDRHDAEYRWADYVTAEDRSCYYELTTDTDSTWAKHSNRIPSHVPPSDIQILSYPALGSWRFIP